MTQNPLMDSRCWDSSANILTLKCLTKNKALTVRLARVTRSLTTNTNRKTKWLIKWNRLALSARLP